MAGHNFCTHCGNPLDEDARFCTSCGQPVEAEDVTQPMPEADETVVAPHPSQTAGFTPIASPHPKEGENPYAATPDVRSDHRETLVIALVGLLVALVTGILLYLFVFSRGSQNAEMRTQPQEGQAAQQQPAETTGADKPKPDASDGKGSAKADEGASQAVADEKLHSDLSEYYGRLPSFDERIREQASHFNASFLDSSMSTRTDYAFACSALMGEVQEQLRGLGALAAPANSKWAGQYELVKRCYADHLARISCINDAWQIDIQYGDPTAHKDEILVPIAAQNGTDGSIPLADYEKTYPAISL